MTISEKPRRKAMSMKESMETAKQLYHMDEFRGFMRKMQGLTDDDFNKPIPEIKGYIVNSKERDPVKMFFEVFERISEIWTANAPIPVNNEWHHFIVPGVVLSSLRNNGYNVTDRDIEEGMARGQKFAGGSCGFMGTCGGAYSVGILASVVKKTTPLHDEERTKILLLVADTLTDISLVGRRCCKRSSYIALEHSIKYLVLEGCIIPLSSIKCRFSSENKMCAGVKCPYHPKHVSQKDIKDIKSNPEVN